MAGKPIISITTDFGENVHFVGVKKGVIQDPEFARSLFSIWLGKRPPTQDLKRGLLGSHPNA